MKHFYPDYNDIHDWVILDTKTIHMYDDAETPIDIVKVRIGTLNVYDIGLNNHNSKTNCDIIRWISKHEFDRLMIDAGVIVW